MSGKLHSSFLFLISFVFTLSILLFSCKKDLLHPEHIIQISSGTDGTLYDILFLNDSFGFISGGDRYHRSDLLTTKDGGKTWNIFHFGEDAQKAVYKLSHFKDKIYASGYDGKFIYKVSPETSWQYIQTAWWQWYESIFFAEANRGYIAVNIGFGSGAILQIDSTGSILKVDSFQCSISDVSFSGANTGFACGYGTILKTSDAGNSWQLQQIAGDNFKSIFCLDEKNIWAAGYNGSIVHSSDGGRNWDKQRNGNDPFLKKYHLNDIFFIDNTTGYIAGDKGLLLKTMDGGSHWSEFKNFTDNDLMAVSDGPVNTIWVTGKEGVVFSITE